MKIMSLNHRLSACMLSVENIRSGACDVESSGSVLRILPAQRCGHGAAALGLRAAARAPAAEFCVGHLWCGWLDAYPNARMRTAHPARDESGRCPASDLRGRLACG